MGSVYSTRRLIRLLVQTIDVPGKYWSVVRHKADLTREIQGRKGGLLTRKTLDERRLILASSKLVQAIREQKKFLERYEAEIPRLERIVKLLETSHEPISKKRNGEYRDLLSFLHLFRSVIKHEASAILEKQRGSLEKRDWRRYLKYYGEEIKTGNQLIKKMRKINSKVQKDYRSYKSRWSVPRSLISIAAGSIIIANILIPLAGNAYAHGHGQRSDPSSSQIGTVNYAHIPDENCEPEKRDGWTYTKGTVADHELLNISEFESRMVAEDSLTVSDVEDYFESSSGVQIFGDYSINYVKSMTEFFKKVGWFESLKQNAKAIYIVSDDYRMLANYEKTCAYEEGKKHAYITTRPSGIAGYALNDFFVVFESYERDQIHSPTPNGNLKHWIVAHEYAHLIDFKLSRSNTEFHKKWEALGVPRNPPHLKNLKKWTESEGLKLKYQYAWHFYSSGMASFAFPDFKEWSEMDDGKMAKHFFISAGMRDILEQKMREAYLSNKKDAREYYKKVLRSYDDATQQHEELYQKSKTSSHAYARAYGRTNIHEDIATMVEEVVVAYAYGKPEDISLMEGDSSLMKSKTYLQDIKIFREKIKLLEEYKFFSHQVSRDFLPAVYQNLDHLEKRALSGLTTLP